MAKDMRIRVSKPQHQKLLTDIGDKLGGTPKDGLEYVLDTWLIEDKPVSRGASTAEQQQVAQPDIDNDDLGSLVDWS